MQKGACFQGPPPLVFIYLLVTEKKKENLKVHLGAAPCSWGQDKSIRGTVATKTVTGHVGHFRLTETWVVLVFVYTINNTGALDHWEKEFFRPKAEGTQQRMLAGSVAGISSKNR